jgi:hypothetical protein
MFLIYLLRFFARKNIAPARTTADFRIGFKIF